MTCCFIGHRKINRTPELQEQLKQTLCELIESGVTVFIFGDHSEFDTLCYETVTRLRETYPHICRVHYRTAYREIDDSVKKYFSVGFEESICPNGVASSGRASYVQRNRAMINDSDICLFFYDDSYRPSHSENSRNLLPNSQRNSGTRLAFEYAKRHKKRVINLNGKTY